MGETLNLVLGAFGVISLVVAALYAGKARGDLVRVQAKSDEADIWRGEAEAIRTRANRLQDENHELTKNNSTLTEALRETAARTDLSRVMEILSQQMQSADTRGERYMSQVSEHFNRHEDRATDRHRVTMEAFSHLNEALMSMSQLLAGQLKDSEAKRAGVG